MKRQYRQQPRQDPKTGEITYVDEPIIEGKGLIRRVLAQIPKESRNAAGRTLLFAFEHFGKQQIVAGIPNFVASFTRKV